MESFRTIIVAEAAVEQAREEAAKTPGGEGMFTAELSPTGLPPATHYISTGIIPLTLDAALQPVESYVDKSEEDPFVAMERLGLKLVSGDTNG